MQKTAVTLRLRVARTWKGRISFFLVSHATASQSMMKDVTPSLMKLGACWMMSGYLLVLFSWFRLKINTCVKDGRSAHLFCLRLYW